jgi:hypothetical protein
MPKFAAGDKVRIRRSDGYIDVDGFVFVGSVGTVVEPHTGDLAGHGPQVTIHVPGSEVAFISNTDDTFIITESALERAD